VIELTERSEQNQGAAGARRRAGRGYRDQTPTDLRGTDMIIRVRVTSLAWAAFNHGMTASNLSSGSPCG
jgi:hypothetical protein